MFGSEFFFFLYIKWFVWAIFCVFVKSIPSHKLTNEQTISIIQHPIECSSCPKSTIARIKSKVPNQQKMLPSLRVYESNSHKKKCFTLKTNKRPNDRRRTKKNTRCKIVCVCVFVVVIVIVVDYHRFQYWYIFKQHSKFQKVSFVCQRVFFSVLFPPQSFSYHQLTKQILKFNLELNM